MSKANLIGGISSLSPSRDLTEAVIGTTQGFQYRLRLSDLENMIIS